MGYFAQGEGWVTIPEGDWEDCFLAAMTALSDLDYGQEQAENLPDLLALVFEDLNGEGDTFWLPYSEKYRESWIFPFLQAIAPFVTTGVVDWRGEGGDIWRHRFHNGDVVEVAGFITYVGDPVG